MAKNDAAVTIMSDRGLTWPDRAAESAGRIRKKGERSMSITRRFALTMAAFALAATLAACGGGEAEQAKTFQEFLQTRILDQKGIRMPKPTDEQRASFGRFAADYDVIVKFNDTLSDAMQSKLPEIMRRGNIVSISQLADRRADLAAAREALAEVNKTMEAALADANAARAKLNQPEPLKGVYDQAFERLVANPAATVPGVWRALDNALSLSHDMAAFLDTNRAKFEFNGPIAQTRDAKLLAEFNKHAEAMRGAAPSINEAQQAMRKLIQGE
jgi:hypothetical protein